MQAPISRSFEVDTVAPDTIVDSGPADPTNSTAPSFQFSADQPGSTFECRLDGGAWTSCTSPKSYTGVTQGSHTFEVRASDSAANTDPTPAQFTWTVDTTDPSSSISFPAASGVYRNATWNDFSGSASDTGGAAVANVQVSISRVSSGLYWDGSAFADGSENWRAATGTTSWSLAFASSNFPADGDYTVSVRATDTATNVQTTPVSRTFTIDNAAPATTITAQPNDPTNSTAPSFSFSSDEPGSTFECQLDTGGWSACSSPKSYTGQTQGSHTFEVRATDTAGNVDASPASFTWTIDTTEPVSTVNFPTAGGFYNTAGWADVDGTASDTGGSALADVQVAIQRVSTSLYWNGATFADGSVNWHAATGTATWSLAFAAANFPDGDDYVVRVRAHDTAGNFEAAGAYSVTYDTVAPTTTIDTQPSVLDNSADAAFTFSSNDPGATFECKLDGAPFSSCSSPKSYSALTDGAHSFQVRATDAAGNTDATPANFDWTIDTTAPTTTIDTQPGVLDNSADAAFTFSSNDPGATFECKLDGAPFSSCSSPKSYSALTDGAHSFQVRATDAAGNTDATPANFDWTIDTTAPTTTIDTQPSVLDNSADAAFTFSSNDPGATFECKLDGAPFSSCSSPKSYSALTDGAHNFQVRATDAAGNTDATPANFDWTIDTTAPTTTIDTQPGVLDNSADAAFTFSSNDPGATFECKLDGAPFSSCSSPKSYSALTDGAHNFQVRATDAAGNTDATPANFDWTIDTTAPSSATSFPANIGSYNILGWNAGCSPSGICGTASDSDTGLDRVEVSIQRAADNQYWNGSAFASATEVWNSAGGTATWTLAFPAATFPGDGSYTIQVRARDNAGNVEAPAGRTFTIDTTAPQTQITAQPNDPTNSTDASFSFSSAEPGATFECKLDGGSFAACTSPAAHTGLSAGPHSFEVRAGDSAGNTDATPAGENWTIDLTAPNSTVSFPTASGSYNAVGWTNPSGTATDAVALDQVEVSLRIAGGNWWNGTDFSATSETWHTATGAAAWSLAFPENNFTTDGNYVIRVRATDAAGNTETPSSRAFTVDTVAPETTIDSSPANPLADADADFTFSADQSGSTFECRIDGGPWTTCTSPRSYTALAEGSHTFEVRATDLGGNADPSPASHTWVIDTVPPVATMADPGQYLKGTVALSSTTTDTGGTGVASVGFERSPAGAGNWTSILAFWDTTGTANGLYDLRVVATDQAGNSSSSPALTGRWVDNLNPTVSLVDPGPVSATVTLAANANDAHSGIKLVEIQVLDGTWQTIGTDATAPYEASWNTTTLPDGPHDLRAIATDHADNVETAATISVIVDNTDPTISFTTPTDGGFVNAADLNPYTVDADAADTGSGVKEVEFFDGPTSLGIDSAAPYEASWTQPVLDGDVTLTAVARDNAGREATTEVTFTVDRTVPDTTLDTNPGNPSSNPTPSFGFTSNEAGTFECSIDGSAWTACTMPYTTAPLADGPRTFEVRAVDAAGNADTTPASWAWLLDATAPTASMDDPGANLRGDIALTSSQADPGATPSGIASVEYEYSVADASTWVSVGPLPWHTNAVTDGLYDVRVVVTDNAGNRTESAPVEDRRIDNSPPATGVDDPGANLRATVTLKGSASDTGSGVQQVEFEYSVDGASWSPIMGALDNSDPYEFALDTAGFADGPNYFFRTHATDVAGNEAWSAGVGPNRIDNTPPVAVMNDPGANLRGTVNLTSTATDDGGSGVASVAYNYTGPETGTTSGTWVTSDVADGVYDLTVVVTDVAGNVTTSNVAAGRRVDNTAPTTGSNAPSGWQSSSVTVALSASDGGSGVSNTQYSLDAGGWNSGTSVNVSGDGVHTISFFSTDVAGNMESTQTATVSIDSTPPDPGALDPGNYLRGSVHLSANPDSGVGGADIASVEFQHKLSSDSTWSSLGVDTDAPYGATWNTTPADDGSWDLRFIVLDTAIPANESSTDLPSKIVDNTPPTGAVASPLTGSVVSGNVTLGVTASDANPIASVEYFVNGSSVGSASATPYQVTWNSGSASDGSRSIHAVITDMAGNSVTTGGVGVTVDNFAPVVSISGLPANVHGTVSLSASASSDTVSVSYEARLLPSGGWSLIGSAVSGAPWQVAWTPSSDGTYEVRAKATDVGSNSGTSPAVTTSVDNTDPSGLLTAPGDGANVGGAVNLAATATDSGSGVASVEWQARTGGGGFAGIGSDSSAPYQATWNVGGLPSGSYDLQLVVTDAAGNTFTSSPITVDVDATAPGVTLANPGSPLSGTIALSAATTGDATAVTFGRSVAGAASWTAISSDGSAPYAANFDTTSVGDGLYDLRAEVRDAVGNTSQSVVGNVRIDNFVPIIISSVPANGSIVASANQITITASEDIASLPGTTLDGVAVTPATTSGATATFNTGPLSDGVHTLTGTVNDAAGNSSSFAISFMVGVPIPPDAGGAFEDILPLVPAPSGFRGVIETDNSLSLRWTPSENADGEPLATVLYINGNATQSLAPGEDSVNLGSFDPADMRIFSIVAVDEDGNASSMSVQLRSSSVLLGKTLDEATASLVNRGFVLGTVKGTGTVVVAPQRALIAPLGSKIDIELGEPGAPQAQLIVTVVGTKQFRPAKQKTIAARLNSTRTAQVTATLLSPKGVSVYRWRFSIKAGTTIKQLRMPPQVKRPGKYRLVFTVRVGRDSVKKTITLQILGKPGAKLAQPSKRPVEIVLAGGSNIRRDIALGLGNGTRVTTAIGEETWTITGTQNRNVQVIVVDVDRYGLQFVRDLRIVFPTVRLLAITNDPRLLARSVRAGAAIAVPRSTPPKSLVKLISQLAKRAS